MASLTVLMLSFLRTANAEVMRKSSKSISCVNVVISKSWGYNFSFYPVLLVLKCSLTYLYLTVLEYSKLCIWEVILLFVH